MAEPRHAPLSFRPSARPARDEEFDEDLFNRAGGGKRRDEIREADGGDESRPPREGLPASYRMRHDKHYVDQIASRRHAEPVHLVPIGQIDGPHPVDAPGDLQPLVKSIGELGVLQPLLVRRRNGRYQLIAGSRRLAAAMAAGVSEVPCLVHLADEEKAQKLADAERIRVRLDERRAAAPTPAPLPPAVFGDVIEHLGAIGACLHLFGERERPLRERVAMGLMQAEVQRAAWLVQALAVLAGDPVRVANSVEINGLVERLLATMAPERALAGVSVDFAPASSPARVRGDEQLLTVAAAALASGVHGLVERVPGARVTIRVTSESGGAQVRVEVSQAVVSLPAEWRGRFFDMSWAERPGGASRGVGLAAARRIAALHGGDLQLETPDRGGCLVRLSLPALP